MTGCTVPTEKNTIPFCILITGKLFPRLEGINTTCWGKQEVTKKAMMQQEGVTEVLKATDQMAWVCSVLHPQQGRGNYPGRSDLLLRGKLLSPNAKKPRIISGMPQNRSSRSEVQQTLNLILAGQHRPSPVAKQQWIYEGFKYSNFMCHLIYPSIFSRRLFHMLSKNLAKITAVGKTALTTDFLNR